MTTYKIKCPHCNRIQKIDTKDVTKARRDCIVCEKNFRVHKNLRDSNIVYKEEGDNEALEKFSGFITGAEWDAIKDA